MNRMGAVAMVLVALTAWAPGVCACPYCDSDIGREVAAKIFDGEFAVNAVQILLPFPFLLGLVAAVHLGRWPEGRKGDSAAPQGPAPGRLTGEELR